MIRIKARGVPGPAHTTMAAEQAGKVVIWPAGIRAEARKNRRRLFFI
jgi:hypothetical protein